MPQIEMPEFSWPDFAETPENDMPVAPTTSADNINDSNPVVPARAMPDIEMPVMEGVDFETCVETINSAASALGPAIVIEDDANRRVVRFKTVQGDLTMSCVDGTMRMEQGQSW
jgi:hypothetical protein